MGHRQTDRKIKPTIPANNKKTLNASCRLRQRHPLKRFALSAAAALFALSAATAQERDYVQYVHTLQGTDSRIELSYGNT